MIGPIINLILLVIIIDIMVLDWLIMVLVSPLVPRKERVVRLIQRSETLIFCLFPWLLLAEWVLKRKAKSSNPAFWHLSIGAAVVIGLGIVTLADHNDLLQRAGGIVFMIAFNLHILSVFGAGGGGGHDKTDPDPDGPTPVADTVQDWLRSLTGVKA